jgi:hypothetical protein
MRTIKRIFVHCSATKPKQNIGAAEIRQWHVKDNGWSDIGYHRVIKRDGTIEKGRADDQIGAHAKGHNADSLAVCMVGGLNEAGQPDCNYTLKQWVALDTVLKEWMRQYHGVTIHGHREVEAGKACPTFDASCLVD